MQHTCTCSNCARTLSLIAFPCFSARVYLQKLGRASASRQRSMSILSTTAAMDAQLSSTNIRFDKNPQRMMEEVVEFLSVLPCTIVSRGPFSLKAEVQHLDGMSTMIKIKCHFLSVIGQVLEWRWDGGDYPVYASVWCLYQDFLRSNTLPSLFEGVSPIPPTLKPAANPCEVPPLFLEGRKRTIDQV